MRTILGTFLILNTAALVGQSEARAGEGRAASSDRESEVNLYVEFLSYVAASQVDLDEDGGIYTWGDNGKCWFVAVYNDGTYEWVNVVADSKCSAALASSDLQEAVLLAASQEGSDRAGTWYADSDDDDLVRAERDLELQGLLLEVAVETESLCASATERGERCETCPAGRCE